MKQDFDAYFDEVIGKGYNFTQKERAELKVSLKNTIARWRLKGMVGKDELPDPQGKRIWEWKMAEDKEMTIRIVRSITKRINNYSRKFFGLKDSSMMEGYVAMMVDTMMKEGMPIRYPNPELIDRFFKGGGIE